MITAPDGGEAHGNRGAEEEAERRYPEQSDRIISMRAYAHTLELQDVFTAGAAWQREQAAPSLAARLRSPAPSEEAREHVAECWAERRDEEAERAELANVSTEDALPLSREAVFFDALVKTALAAHDLRDARQAQITEAELFKRIDYQIQNSMARHLSVDDEGEIMGTGKSSYEATRAIIAILGRTPQ